MRLQETKLKILHEFTIPGPPVGFYVLGSRPDWLRKQAYHKWLKSVRRVAREAGVPVGQMSATKRSPMWIETVAWFANGRHPDPENVRKAVADALFYTKANRRGSADKFVGGAFPPPLYDAENPRVEVMVAAVDPPEDREVPVTPLVCGDGVPNGPLGEPVYCELPEGHVGDHSVRSGNAEFIWRQRS